MVTFLYLFDCCIFMVHKGIRTYRKGYLDVGDGHRIYYELSGNRKGKPVLFVHGGPGGGCSEKDKRFFNPKKFNIITFDQRGSGKSKPFASIKNNTTFKLVKDMRKLLRFLGIKKVILFGGSWGSTLSLVYAIKHPETVLGMVVRGIFLGNKEEDDYLVYGARKIYPEAWERMASLVPNRNRKDIMAYYLKNMKSKDKRVRKRYSLEWARYEFSVSSLKYSEKKVKELLKIIKYEAFSIIELHYLTNECFLPKNYILKNVGKFRFPVSIVHGRYDIVCEPLSAYELSKKIKNCRLFFTLAGHSTSDSESEDILVKEMDRFGR